MSFLNPFHMGHAPLRRLLVAIWCAAVCVAVSGCGPLPVCGELEHPLRGRFRVYGEAAEENVWYVYYAGNSFDGIKSVQLKATRRAIELARQRGFAYFEILNLPESGTVAAPVHTDVLTKDGYLALLDPIAKHYSDTSGETICLPMSFNEIELKVRFYKALPEWQGTRVFDVLALAKILET